MPTTKKSTDDIKTAAKPAAPKKTASRAPKKAKAVEPPVEELSPEVVEAINVIKTPPPKAVKQHERIFALDIGTRSVIGIVAEEGDDENLHVIATDRLEHKTRAMLDGQIHDVPQVAAIVERIAGGEQPEDIPYETLADYARFVNLQAAERIGIEVSDDILAAYNVLVEADGTSHFGE